MIRRIEYWTILICVLSSMACIKRPPDGPESSKVNEIKVKTSLTLFYRGNPGCGESTEFSLHILNDSAKYEHVATSFYHNNSAVYYKYNPPVCRAVGTLYFVNLDQGKYRLDYSDCSNIQSKFFTLGEACRVWTPHVNEGDSVNISFFTGDSSDVVVSLIKDGMKQSGLLKALSTAPVNCLESSKDLKFHMPAGDYEISWGPPTDPNRFNQKKSFYFECNTVECEL